MSIAAVFSLAAWVISSGVEVLVTLISPDVKSSGASIILFCPGTLISSTPCLDGSINPLVCSLTQFLKLLPAVPVLLTELEPEVEPEAEIPHPDFNLLFPIKYFDNNLYLLSHKILYFYPINSNENTTNNFYGNLLTNRGYNFYWYENLEIQITGFSELFSYISVNIDFSLIQNTFKKGNKIIIYSNDNYYIKTVIDIENYQNNVNIYIDTIDNVNYTNFKLRKYNFEVTSNSNIINYNFNNWTDTLGIPGDNSYYIIDLLELQSMLDPELLEPELLESEPEPLSYNILSDNEINYFKSNGILSYVVNRI